MPRNHSLQEAVMKWPDNHDKHWPALCKSTICFSYSACIFVFSALGLLLMKVCMCSCCIGREIMGVRIKKAKYSSEYKYTRGVD